MKNQNQTSRNSHLCFKMSKDHLRKLRPHKISYRAQRASQSHEEGRLKLKACHHQQERQSHAGSDEFLCERSDLLFKTWRCVRPEVVLLTETHACMKRPQIVEQASDLETLFSPLPCMISIFLFPRDDRHTNFVILKLRPFVGFFLGRL